MLFPQLEIKREYRSLSDNIARNFYIPLLGKAIWYKRAVGFFSSSALIEISKGIAGLIKNGGQIQLIASPRLSNEDIEAINKGYEVREHIIERALLRTFDEPKDYFEKERLNLLANLIALGTLDLKIAFTLNKNKLGIFHEKMGVICDAENNTVAFSGSMNETMTAFLDNYESIDVFCSWKTEFEKNKVADKNSAFDNLWNDTEPNVKIIDFPKVAYDRLQTYKNDKVNWDIDKEEMAAAIAESGNDFYFTDRKNNIPIVPDNVTFFGYQLEAIDEWEKKRFCGIFDMATGTGKTYTGLGAVVRLCDAVEGQLAVFITAPFQHLVEQWVDDIVKFNMKPIIGYSTSAQKDWKHSLEDAIRDQKLKVRNKEFFCFICTNATFSSKFVQFQIQRLRGNALLIVDEAHNFGAENLSNLLSDKFQFRMALSATIDRYNDEEGTARLYGYFGEKCIEYTLERAIGEKQLTPYKYYPVIVTLNKLELEKYSDLTNEIVKCIIKGKKGKIRLSEKGKRLALARARIVAGAQRKISKLEEYIKPYLEDRHILVYCGSTKILNDDEDYTSVDEDDFRQIAVVTALLGNKLNMRVSQFTSREDVYERAILKGEFSKGDTLQVLIAIKCLDEGVNIPSIKVAFILASTTNPKEYIQRRGRVLRLVPGKQYAEIYDFITLPRPLDEVPSLTQNQLKKECTLVRNELNRGEEFARLAINMVEAESVLNEIKEAYALNDNLLTFEEDLGYGE